MQHLHPERFYSKLFCHKQIHFCQYLSSFFSTHPLLWSEVPFEERFAQIMLGAGHHGLELRLQLGKELDIGDVGRWLGQLQSNADVLQLSAACLPVSLWQKTRMEGLSLTHIVLGLKHCFIGSYLQSWQRFAYEILITKSFHSFFILFILSSILIYFGNHLWILVSFNAQELIFALNFMIHISSHKH